MCHFFDHPRSWCPDRVLPQALKYISESMGVKFAEGVILNVEEMWIESNNRVPMICFLSMGSDPTNTIDMLSRKHNLSKFLSVYLKAEYLYNANYVFSIWVCIYGPRTRGTCSKAPHTVPTAGNLLLHISTSISNLLPGVGRLGSSAKHSLSTGLSG